MLAKSSHSINATVSIFTEIPAPLHECLKDYLQQHPDWHEHRVLTAAVSLFMLQNAEGDRRIAQVYLETLLRRN